MLTGVIGISLANVIVLCTTAVRTRGFFASSGIDANLQPEYTILLNQCGGLLAGYCIALTEPGRIQRVLHAMLSCRIILGLRAIAARFETQAYSSREYSIDRSWVGGGEHESL